MLYKKINTSSIKPGFTFKYVDLNNQEEICVLKGEEDRWQNDPRFQVLRFIEGQEMPKFSVINTFKDMTYDPFKSFVKGFEEDFYKIISEKDLKDFENKILRPFYTLIRSSLNIPFNESSRPLFNGKSYLYRDLPDFFNN